MQVYITSLNSGSNGNCYYIGNDTEAVLVDAGISCRETEKRMKRLGLSMGKVKAIFISHEHSDHIKGVAVLAKKYELPVYITPTTLYSCSLRHENIQAITFQAHEPVTIGNLSVTAFPKLHDATDPHSFVVACGDVKIGIFTDIGSPCDQLIHHFQQCHAAFLEANFDEGMLERGRYPYHLKNRIRGGKGHLSNRQAIALFAAYKPDFMSHILLSHLSKDNNNPQLVKDLFTLHADGTEVVVASRYEETPVYGISATSFFPTKPQASPGIQTSLFDW
ncbi:MBL fold metallo-hydrolase [Pontibacter rugosus]|uniref:MBL fold metallo-hydrolase n=1 Tax=Pontibacter rugosus TaxID=1745966 RepID=A0ABW3SKE2_9BACT